MMNEQQIKRLIYLVVWPCIIALGLLVVVLMSALYLRMNPNPTQQVQSELIELGSTEVELATPEVVKGVHVATGLKDAAGLEAVLTNCTGCHSAKLIIQNRMSADKWRHTIRWMQRTQNLWDLGENEDIIVNYLAVNYAPIKKGRRQKLADIEWYELAIDKIKE